MPIPTLHEFMMYVKGWQYIIALIFIPALIVYSYFLTSDQPAEQSK